MSECRARADWIEFRSARSKDRNLLTARVLPWRTTGRIERVGAHCARESPGVRIVLCGAVWSAAVALTMQVFVVDDSQAHPRGPAGRGIARRRNLMRLQLFTLAAVSYTHLTLPTSDLV